MRIIIEVKETATLSRIEALDRDLQELKRLADDVIKSIEKEW